MHNSWYSLIFFLFVVIFLGSYSMMWTIRPWGRMLITAAVVSRIQIWLTLVSIIWDNAALCELWHSTAGSSEEICDLQEERMHDRNFTGREKVSQQEHGSASRAKRKHWPIVRHARIPPPSAPKHERANTHTGLRTHTAAAPGHAGRTYLRKHDLTSSLPAHRCASVRDGGVVACWCSVSMETFPVAQHDID